MINLEYVYNLIGCAEKEATAFSSTSWLLGVVVLRFEYILIKYSLLRSHLIIYILYLFSILIP